MKHKLLIPVLLLFVFGLQAQSPGKILSLATKAAGGEKSLKSVSAKEFRGRITGQSDGASGKYILRVEKPNLLAEIYELNGFEYARGFNGKSGWIRDSKNGLRTLTGDAANDFQAEAAFRSSLWLEAKTDKTKIVSAGKTEIAGKAADAILLTTAKGIQLKLYFDSVSKLLLREEIPQGEDVKINDYADYRKIGKTFHPFSIVSKIAGETFEIKIDEINFPQNFAKSVFDFPKISDAPLPDIKSLLVKIRANADKVDQILENYGYTETRTEREIDKAGNLIVKDSETTSLSFYKGYRIRRLIAKNGKSLSSDEQASEDKKVEKQVMEIEKRIAEREEKRERDLSAGKTGTPENENNQRISLSDALRGSLLVNPRRERLDGRDVIVFDYEPNPDFKPQSRIEKLFALCTGAVWVDENDKQVIRLEAFLTKSAGNFIGKVKRGASFSLENKRINDEIWLPVVADVNLSVKILFAGININNLITYGDYKRFNAEIKEGKTDEPKP